MLSPGVRDPEASDPRLPAPLPVTALQNLYLHCLHHISPKPRQTP